MRTRIQHLCLPTAVIILVVTTFSIALASQNSQREGGDLKPVVIKMATLAPNGSPWHEILKDMAAEWAAVSNGQVRLRIYPGGVAGDESDMVRKIRIGLLQAAAITNSGLSRIATEVTVLTIPMAIDSWKSLDRVRDKMAPRLEALLNERGFVVLNWADAGWVRFFVPGSSPTVKAVQKAKLFVWAGDDRTVGMWKAAHFRVVPLAVTDILPGLQTGMINAFNSTPIMALVSQWFPFTDYMIDMPWAPLVGATVISSKAWNKIPEALQPKLREIAQSTGARIQLEIRQMEEDAIAEMQKRGLKVITPNADEIKEWRQVMQTAYPKIRGPMVPEKWFDDAMRAASAKSLVDGS